MDPLGGCVAGALRRGPGFTVILLAVPALTAAVYYLLALVAALRWGHPPGSAQGDLPPVSILKPMHGTAARLYAAIRSYAAQDYPEFELLFGAGDAEDPALKEVDRLRQEFPSLLIRVVIKKPDAPNQKASVLAAMAAQASHGLLVVSDDDIVAGPDYLRSVVAPFRDPSTGLVTCLYRAHAESLAALAEALGIATEFAPSVMVARMLGVVEFALGSTIALRSSILREIGGFEAVAGYLADDYQLGRRVAGQGYRVEFAAAVVETGEGQASWRGVWRHQVRWSRTIRVSRPGGYYGSLITQATIWALVAFAGRQWWAGAAALALRMAAGMAAGSLVLRDRQVRRWFWLVPVRDLFGFAVWLGGCFGSTVHWRGRKLRLDRDGRIGASR